MIIFSMKTNVFHDLVFPMICSVPVLCYILFFDCIYAFDFYVSIFCMFFACFVNCNLVLVHVCSVYVCSCEELSSRSHLN